MIDCKLGSVNVGGIRSIVQQILEFVNIEQSNIDMFVNYELIHSDNIYLT